MATNFTYDQFEQEARKAGLYDQFSVADLNLAKTNPDAGMSILKYKQDYANAPTAEARELANLGAENIRSSYGGYTGGSDGGSFAPTQPSSGGSFTYDQFVTEAQNLGLYDQFSAADLNLARNNPDAGMSILKYKQDYANASTAEARELANLGAENIRSSYGGYTGGGDGGSFSLTPLSPNNFNYEKAPEFNYNPDTDPVYAAYQKQYAREGQRATQDALGAASAATGGIPSSYAVTAASQTGDYYAAQMADKIPQLYQQAYERHLAELSQYNTDRNFAYGQHLDEINSQTQERQEALEKATLAAQYGDNSFLNDMGIDTSNNPADWERQYTLAVLAAENGDYSGLQALGIDTSKAGYEQQLNEALLAAEYGDYSKLQAMGIDTSKAGYEQQLNEALLAAEYGDYSKLKAMGIDTSKAGYEQQLNEALLAAEYGDYSKLQAMGIDTSKAGYEQQLNEALLAAEYGDYSKLKAMGIDTSKAGYEQQLNEAMLAAEYGDYSKLKAMGIDTSNNPADYEQRYNLALLKAQYGDYSGLRELGVDTSALTGSGSSSGVYYGGGGGSSTGSSDSESPTAPRADGAEEKMSLVDQLLTQYPDGNIPIADAFSLQRRYGITPTELGYMDFTVKYNS